VASAASPTAPAAAPQFAVLVGAFPTEPAAQEVATRLSNRGLSTVVARSSERGTGGTYSVLIGHFADMAQAQQVRDGLASEEGFAGAQIVQTKNGNASAP
jgi:cell division septation protein DedD